jgi:hypothetical protein
MRHIDVFGGIVQVLMSDSKQSKFILCRPFGGMNDTLVQIAKCYRYAQKHKRRLIIDTTRSGMYLPFDRFFEMAKPDPSVVLSLDYVLLAHLETLQCYPGVLQGRIGSYKTKNIRGSGGQREVKSGVFTRLNFQSSAIEPLVVHECFGGGRHSKLILGLLCLREKVADEINRRLATLPASYVAIHIRNTDMQTDYLEFFDVIRTQVEGHPIVLCSDDDDVKAQAIAIFGQEYIIGLRQIAGFGSKPLHSLGSKISDQTKFKIMLDALTDLMAMALSQKVYSPKNIDGKISGFGKLGMLLQTDKAIALQLLRRTTPIRMKIMHSVKVYLEWRHFRLAK